MRRGRKHYALFFVTGLVTISLPAISVKLLSIETVSGFISETLKTDNISFLGLALDYFSLSITLLLGIIVYFQAERINSLEATQYNLFLGVEDLDYEFDFGDCFASERGDSTFQISHIFTSTQKAILSTINIEEGKGKTLLLPLAFVSKNCPLIVSINFKQVHVIANQKNRQLFNQAFFNTGNKINTILRDDSRFIFGFGMVIPEKYNLDEIHLQFDIELEDQNMNLVQIQTCVSLCKLNNDGDYLLTSSSSKAA